jgi:hypothetical protein
MKIFKIEGWYKYKYDKDFTSLTFECINSERAIDIFKLYYKTIKFYKIDIKEML